MALPFSLHLLFSIIIFLRLGRTQIDSAATFIYQTPSFFSVVIPTAHSQYCYLNTVPVFYFVVFPQNKCRRLGSTLLVALIILLSGDVQVNPGPATPLTLCTLNIRSLFAENRSVFISDLLTSENIDIFALAETFQNSSVTPAQLLEVAPQHFQFFGQPRCHHVVRSTRARSVNIGGGLGFLVRDSLSPDLVSLPLFASFQSFAIGVRSRNSKLTIFNIYRPPDSSSYSKPFSTFLSEFCSFLSSAATTPHDVF